MYGDPGRMRVFKVMVWSVNVVRFVSWRAGNGVDVKYN
jgi:hypothetical protein